MCIHIYICKLLVIVIVLGSLVHSWLFIVLQCFLWIDVDVDIDGDVDVAMDLDIDIDIDMAIDVDTERQILHT